MGLDHLDELIPQLESRYGKPIELWMGHYPIHPGEMELVLRAKSKGRAHDITLVIFWDPDRKLVPVIRKHSYPSWLYRLPSGAVEPGESFQEGVLRESLEETGAIIELDRYLIRSRVKFSCGAWMEDWCTHVFSGFRVAGQLQPKDCSEISGIKLIQISELSQLNPGLRKVGGGFSYRADLNNWILYSLGHRF